MKNNNDYEDREHWVFKKHTQNIQFFVDCATYLKQNNSGVSSLEKKKMFDKLKKSKHYNPRNQVGSERLDAMNHRINGLEYFMFGYSDKVDGRQKFIFSPLGNLFLKYLGDEKTLAKIFTTMLYGIQFPHPASKPSINFLLFPFRLIFALLLEPKLNGILYNYEIYKFLIYVDSIDSEKYSKLVRDIVNARTMSEQEKFDDLKSRESVIVKSTYEWQYYIAPLLSSVGVINCSFGKNSIKLYHPQKEGSTSKPTARNIHDGYFSLSPVVLPLVKKLIMSYSVFEHPLLLSDSRRKSNDVVKEIYSFFPEELLQEIGETPDETQIKLLELPKLIEKYSHNPKNQTADRFENILEEAFNMFINVDASKLSGPGRTDIECLYITANDKFAVEAKSTANKLSGINSGRLKHHRQLIGASYTIVVTPRYVPSVKYDISGQQIVIVKANTLSEYLYNNIVNDHRDIDYGEIQNIIQNNLGKDISPYVSDLTLANFG